MVFTMSVKHLGIGLSVDVTPYQSWKWIWQKRQLSIIEQKHLQIKIVLCLNIQKSRFYFAKTCPENLAPCSRRVQVRGQ